MDEDRPGPAMVLRGRDYAAVVFSNEQAMRLFDNIPDLRLMFCVEPPRSALVTCASDARKFFKGE
jgi:hypothetical protein